MPPIGETLREARLRQQIDIAEVEQATKIRAKYLRALEGEEFDRLPGSTFVRTFLRTYADYLGVDSQLLVEEYRAQHESPDEDELPHFAAQPPPRPLGGEGRRRSQPGGGGPGRGTIIAAAAIGVLALLLVIGLIGGAEEGERDGEVAEIDQEEGRREGRERRPQVEQVRLEVSPLTETYVCVEDGDGERVFEGIIAEPETFRAETLLVNLGNTQVELTRNGEEVPVEQGSNPVGFEFTPDGQEELPAGERPCV